MKPAEIPYDVHASGWSLAGLMTGADVSSRMAALGPGERDRVTRRLLRIQSQLAQYGAPDISTFGARCDEGKIPMESAARIVSELAAFRAALETGHLPADWRDLEVIQTVKKPVTIYMKGVLPTGDVVARVQHWDRDPKAPLFNEIIDMQTGESRAVSSGTEMDVFGVTRDGRVLFRVPTPALVDPATGEKELVDELFEKSGATMAYRYNAPTDEIIRIADNDITYLYAVDTGERRKIGHPTPFSKFSGVTTDGFAAFVVTDDATIRMIHIPTGETVDKATYREDSGVTLAIVGGGALVGKWNGSVWYWKPETYDLRVLSQGVENIRRPSVQGEFSVYSHPFEPNVLAFLEDEVDGKKKVVIIDADTRGVICAYETYAEKMGIAPNGNIVLSGLDTVEVLG